MGLYGEKNMKESVRVVELSHELGILAMKFRSTKDEYIRNLIAEKYAIVTKKLIKTKKWFESPPPEDMLPDEFMPKEFFDFWRTNAF